MSDPRFPSFPELRTADETVDPRVKPCPFCGFKAQVVSPVSRWDVAKVECLQCGAVISCSKVECAIENWNRRTNAETNTPS